MEGVYREKVGARELPPEEKQRHLSPALGRELEGVLCRSPFSVGMQRAQVTDYLIGGDQEIPDWLIKNLFLGAVGTAVNSITC